MRSFWLELGDTVRGNSLTIPGLNSTGPKWTSFLIFSNNTAHSNDDAGIRTYPHGMRPRINSVRYYMLIYHFLSYSSNDLQNTFGPRNVFDGCKIWKNALRGFVET